MKKLYFLIKKDLMIEFSNKVKVFFFLAIPFFYFFVMNFLSSVVTDNINVNVDKTLKGVFKNRNCIYVSYLTDNKIKLNLIYKDFNELKKAYKDEKINFFLYKKGKMIGITMKKADEKTRLVYELIYRYFYPNKVFKFEKIESKFNYSLFLVLNIFIVLGSMMMAMHSLRREIEDKNITMLLKAGITPVKLIISKILFVFFSMNLLLGIFVAVFQMLYKNVFNFSMIVPLYLLIIFSISTGLLISNITINPTMQSNLLYILWMPSLFFRFFKEYIGNMTVLFFFLDPLIFIADFLERLLNLHISNWDYIILVTGTIFFNWVSISLLKKRVLNGV